MTGDKKRYKVSIGVVAVVLVAGGVLAGAGRAVLVYRATSVMSNVELDGLIQRNRTVSGVHRGFTALVRYFEEGKWK
ncbi:hypothetical protein SAMN04489729_5931 [Amycolatopsis lurida]|uniref:Uncharacterized protein n=1 Tax=Amycolatopsis lurida NRRL 2430 TaxID=1460371 RepID=A0A2P2FY54_AMYLU|nr:MULTISPECIES: hypothetical protein [Amycolatopsis]KFU81660.1 hypothetical protein BB31_09825 [Amycolatopsis lurida NRRL 2430]QXV61469.1 hypothetical protein CVV72_33715 [Amycolatopsis sp. TNS106]SED97764.1 hypothetical protein SAMN04489729_5931 [Amycolatopsis lurida]